MRLLLIFMLMTAGVPVAAQNLLVTLASEPPTADTLSARDADTLMLRVVSGQRVTLSRSAERDYELQARRGFTWSKIQERPLNEDYVAITPVLQSDGSATVAVDVYRKEGTRTRQYSSMVLANPGEWVQLLGPVRNQQGDSKVYGIRRAAGDSLYLRVE